MRSSSRSSRRALALASLALLAAAAAGCVREEQPDTVVVYSAHDLVFAEPILDEFERRTGFHVELVGDTEASKTTGLVNRLIQLAAHPEADVFWNNELMNSVRLAELGLVEPYAPPSGADVPAEWRDAHDRWLGFAARARVILYNRELVPEADAPRSIFDLTAERFRGRVALANPLFGTTATQAAALFCELGEERAKRWFAALRANDCRIVAGNAMARNLVASGELAVCLTDTDDANGALLAGKPVEMVYPDQDGIGTLVIPNSVVLIAGAPHPVAARALIDYLASREVEERLARSESAQMPLRPGIAPYDERFDLARIRRMHADWDAIARALPECMRFLRETFVE